MEKTNNNGTFWGFICKTVDTIFLIGAFMAILYFIALAIASVMFGLVWVIGKLLDLRPGPPAANDPRNQPLFPDSKVVPTLVTAINWLISIVVVAALCYMALGSFIQDIDMFCLGYKIVLTGIAFLVLRYALLPFLMRRASYGVLTHASWVTAILTWPVYATALLKLGLPTTIYNALTL